MAEHYGDDGMDKVAFVVDQEPNTTCRRVYALLERMLEENDHQPHEDALVQLGNQLMSVTRTFGLYFLALDERIMNRDYSTALQIGRAMVEHEALLHKIAAGQPIRIGQTLN